MFRLLYARYILGVAGQVVLTNHYLVNIRWFQVVLGCCLSFSSVDATGILNTDWDGKPPEQITTRNTAVFRPLSLHMSARSWYLIFSNSWKCSVLSFQDTVSSNGYTYHRSISGLNVSWGSSTGFAQQAGICWDVYFCIFLSHKANEFPPSLSRWFFSLSSTYLWSHLYRCCDR